MKKFRVLFPTGLIAIMAFFAMSCEKNELSPISDPDVSTDILLAQDDVVSDDIYNDIDADIQSAVQTLEENEFQTVSTKSADDEFPCLEVTVDHPDTTQFPKVISFDYGEGCMFIINGDTITKKGMILVTLTDRFFNPGAQRIVTFKEFYMNEVKVEGTITSTYIGINDDELLEYTMILEDGKLIYNDTTQYTREARHKKEWYRSSVPVEDSLYISGSMWGTNIEGVEYSREITDKLTLAHCSSYGRRWVIVDGEVVSTVGDIQTVIDYSDGGCDGTAMVIGNGIHQRIRVREHHRNRIHKGQ